MYKHFSLVLKKDNYTAREDPHTIMDKRKT